MTSVRAILVFVLSSAVPTLGQSILYVDLNATGPVHDGSSWCNGFVHLQDAIAAARASGGLTAEIRVADGVYKPDRGADQTLGDTNASFELVDGVALMGGYAGCGAADPNLRDIAALETVLSGDLLDNDGPGFVDINENTRVVVFVHSSTIAVTLDGLTISNGNFSQGPGGAGLFFAGREGMFRNVQFRDNWSRFGGAAYVLSGDAVSFHRCRFFNNAAGAAGGAIFVYGAKNLLIAKCEFVENQAQLQGGAVWASGFPGVTTITDTVFARNRAGLGGGVWAQTRSGTFTAHGCVFIDNTAADGAGLFAVKGTVGLSSCTFFSNVASNRSGGVRVSIGGELVISNCILWNNIDRDGADELSQIDPLSPPNSPSTVTINHSLVQGWTGAFGGVGNIGGDPMFVDALGPDGIGGTEDDDLRLRRGSPSIDAGDNAAVPMDEFDLDGDGDFNEAAPFDLLGRPRFVNDPLTPDTGAGDRPIVDMGALERQVVLLDIRPGHCPNRFDPRSRGLMKIAVVGTQTFDVSQIDRDSLALSSSDEEESIHPVFRKRRRKHRRALRDVTAPTNADLCDCDRTRRDGILDLVLSFPRRDVADLLDDDDEHHRGESVVLTLTGRTFDGDAFEASDCIRIVGRHDR